MIVPPPATNEVSFYTVYDTGGEWPDNRTTNAPAFSSPPPASTFSFQYGMCSTNPDPVIWAQVGTNLVGVDPFPSNNITAPSGVLWTVQDTTDTLDVIYYVRNLLYRSTYVQTNGNQTVYNDNLNFVVFKAIPPLFSPWQPLYTNGQPIMDYPYTFTDTNATDPAALYRVGWQ